jgi:RNA polymerase sigma factor (sigma-70 family)
MNVQAAQAFRRLREAVLLHDSAQRADGDLLGAFIAHRDATAFAGLVRRHGPMVLGVCRRILRDAHDAEDAFQATFLVLARRATAVVPRTMVGNWLYGVAYRTALEAKRMIARRRSREKQMRDLPQTPVEPKPCTADLQALLDQELSRLPDKLRLPVVLCDLEGRTRREVARQLGIPEGTLSNRLASARRTLAKRLAHRGLTLSAGSLAATLAQVAGATVPPTLLTTTVRAVAAGTAAAHVAKLTEGVLQTMFLAKLKVVTLILLVLGAVASAVFWASRPEAVAGSPQSAVTPASPNPAAQDQPKKDMDSKAVLEKAVKAASAIPATKDEDLRRKVDMLTSIASYQARTKDMTGAAATFKLALEVAGTIKAELARAEAQAHVGYYQAYAGLIADAQKTSDGITVKDEKLAQQAQDHRNHILKEMTAHLAKTGELQKALKIAESIPERVLKFKAKDDKVVERRDSMDRDTALQYVAEAQLKAGDVAGALQIVRTMKTRHPYVWTFRAVIIAQGNAGDLAAAGKLLKELRKEMEADKGSSSSINSFIASTQAAMGDAEGALVWINELKSEEERASALLGVSIGLAERDLIQAKQPKKGQ